MASKRETLHGVDSIEKSSPLKKQLGKLHAGENNILKDDNYVDVGLTTVLTSVPKRRKTNYGLISDDVSSEAMSCQRADNIDLFTTEDYSQKDDVIFQDDAGTHGKREINTFLSNEFLEVEAGGGVYVHAYNGHLLI